MKITNKFNLPENIVNAVKKSTHVGADYSASMLENSARQVWLTKRHDAEIEQDASDMVFSLFGSAFHHILQSGETANQLVEEYLTDTIGGVKLSGMADLYEDGKITDYKTTSAWTMIYGSRVDDWTKQLNIYAYLYGKANFEVKELEIIAFLRDWSKSKAKYDPAYPQSQVAVVKIELWDKAKVFDYIVDRIGEFEKYKQVADNELPYCTDKEVWQKENVYKCMKEGRKSSVKNFEVKADAEKYCFENKLKLVEFLGERVKCEDYCPAKKFCSQYAEYKKENTNGQDNI